MSAGTQWMQPERHSARLPGGVIVTYVGLTDDPARRRVEHGDPPDWQQTSFQTEAQARAWEASCVGRPGFRSGAGGTGWRYGYWYTITPWTRQ